MDLLFYFIVGVLITAGIAVIHLGYLYYKELNK